MTDLLDAPDVAHDVGDGAGRRAAPRRSPFAPLLLAITIGALVLRVGVVFAVEDVQVGGDGFAYLYGAAALADGDGYTSVFVRGQPEAHHPPAWLTVLAIPFALGIDDVRNVQLFAALIGTGVVALVGLAGRRVAGPRVGLIAAALAAVYPGFWKFEAELLSETLVLGLMALSILLAYRYRDRPTWRGAVALGLTIGVAVLTRPELVLLLPLLALPLVLPTDQPLRSRLGHLGIIGGLAVLLVAPWTAHNLGRFDEPVILSTGLGGAMRIANCDGAFYGERTGYWDFACIIYSPSTRAGGDRSELDVAYRDEAVDYIRGHLDRWPAVQLARQGRNWSVYRPGQQINLDHEWSLSPTWILWAQLLTFWALVLPTVAGGVALRRRRVLLWPLLVPFAGVLITSLAVTGEPRYRAPAEVSIVILSAVAIEAAWRWWRTGRRWSSERRTRPRGDPLVIDVTKTVPEIDLRTPETDGAH